jgi:predicted PurR-regulated permease PerM
MLGRTAQVCLQLLVIAAALWLLGQVLAQLSVVVIPFGIALLLAGLFGPPTTWLARKGLPRSLAMAIVLLAGLAAVGGLVYFIVSAVTSGLPGLRTQVGQSLGQLQIWLSNGPLGLHSEQVDSLVAEVRSWVGRNSRQLVSGAWGVFSTVGSVLAGLALSIFILIFLIHDGRRLWTAVISPLPDSVRATVDRAGTRSFTDLIAFVRATVAVAAIDAVGIGIGLWIVGVPLVIPLATLVFLGAFVPLVGAFVSGLLAVLVALVAEGPIAALIVVAIVVGVQQLEGNVLEPLLMSNAVRLHPVAVILAVAVGVNQAGIAGALLAVPLLTTVRAIAETLQGEARSRDGTSRDRQEAE